ncbi:PepSY domain-containing protein [Roseibacterium sp. SDUM158017]|uniref:PepSY domain-containing protein n=1 Tax=Roseicyclus salinarum TaxID=3036773 RepID=UPI0024156F35|nr:PepSY domain-containing protein [Roseibacterium sp. SDUM158017]MDG4650453.1 PepSY domain-containing protein [Roseibacterium sp. SDUM158017]
MHRLLMTAAALTALAAPAFAMPGIGDAVGTTLDEARSALAAQGLTMTEYDLDDGRIEITAHDDETRVELYLDPQSGAVTGMEITARRAAGAQAGVETQAALDALAADGWEILGFDREAREFEVHARRDGVLYELRLDPATGAVTEMERE